MDLISWIGIAGHTIFGGIICICGYTLIDLDRDDHRWEPFASLIGMTLFACGVVSSIGFFAVSVVLVSMTSYKMWGLLAIVGQFIYTAWFVREFDKEPTEQPQPTH